MIVVHYGEIFTKGLNRAFFQKTLERNLCAAVPSAANIRLESHRFLIDAPREALDAVGKTFGVVSYAWAEEAKPTLEDIQVKALTAAGLAKQPLKVKVRRSDKAFPLNSMQVAQNVADFLEKRGVALSVRNYASLLEIEVLKNRALVYAEKYRGLGGLPVGSSGKVVTLLSGGIDSPVAAYLLAKRGVTNVFIHFHPFKPGEEKTRKIEDLVARLYPYTLSARVYFVPFAPFTLASLSLPERLVLPVFRRFMLKVAEKIAWKEGAKAVGTGESLSQVASQTLENMAAIEEAVSMPVLRPLLTYDKQEIIALAKSIGTHDLSLRAYNDCCQSLVSEHPATRCNAEQLKRLEAELPKNLVETTLEQTKVVEVDV